jgi:hypothetical protein
MKRITEFNQQKSKLRYVFDNIIILSIHRQNSFRGQMRNSVKPILWTRHRLQLIRLQCNETIKRKLTVLPTIDQKSGGGLLLLHQQTSNCLAYVTLYYNMLSVRLPTNQSLYTSSSNSRRNQVNFGRPADPVSGSDYTNIEIRFAANACADWYCVLMLWEALAASVMLQSPMRRALWPRLPWNKHRARHSLKLLPQRVQDIGRLLGYNTTNINTQIMYTTWISS